jgi:hypothetical protein
VNSRACRGLRLALTSGMLAGIETAVAFLIIMGTMVRILVDDDAR